MSHIEGLVLERAFPNTLAGSLSAYAKGEFTCRQAKRYDNQRFDSRKKWISERILSARGTVFGEIGKQLHWKSTRRRPFRSTQNCFESQSDRSAMSWLRCGFAREMNRKRPIRLRLPPSFFNPLITRADLPRPPGGPLRVFGPGVVGDQASAAPAPLRRDLMRGRAGPGHASRHPEPPGMAAALTRREIDAIDRPKTGVDPSASSGRIASRCAIATGVCQHLIQGNQVFKIRRRD